MLSIVIQAGGQSRRMGQDKGLLSFHGQPLAARVLARVMPIADEILITTNHPINYQFLGVPLFADLIPGRGALGGLYTALSAASYMAVAVIACDMPFINPQLLAAQYGALSTEDVDIVILQTDGGLEPFHAVYRRETCLPHITAALQANQWRVDSWFNQVKVRIFPSQEIAYYDPAGLSSWNVNTPEDLQAALQIATSQEKP